MDKLTHFDEKGRAKMVDISGKRTTAREAVAKAVITMKAGTLRMIMEGKVKKGDVFTTAKIAGIMGAKKTSELVPMCHPLDITGVDISFRPSPEDCFIEIESKARVVGRTGVEMEALTAVSIAALTIYDMCKAVDKGMTISDIRLISKKGGKSGTFVRKE